MCSNSNLYNFHQLEFLGDRKMQQKNAHMQSHGHEITCLGMNFLQITVKYTNIQVNKLYLKNTRNINFSSIKLKTIQ